VSGSQAAALLRGWCERFRKDRLASNVVAELGGRGDEIWRHAFALLQQESPEYRNSVDDEFAKESKAHCNQLLATIVAIAGGKEKRLGADAFGFVRLHAEWRARHHVPLIASLHAYRLAHRTYWAITRDALLRGAGQKAATRSLAMLSDFWIELFDHVGAVLGEAHAVEEGLIVAQGTRAYVELIDDLLRGRSPRDAQARQLLALSGIRPGSSLAVAVLRPRSGGNGTPIDLEVTLRSLLRLLGQVLPSTVFGKLIDIRAGEVAAIVSSESDAGRRLLEVLGRSGFARRAGNGLAAGVGISRDTDEIARLPEAIEEARLAVEFAGAARPLMHFSDIDLRDFLVRRADKAAFRLIPDWARRLGSADDGRAHELLRTIRAFADCNLNVKQTARRVDVHINTVYFRLNRIKKLTGIDPRTYSGTSLLLTALQLLEAGVSSAQPA
jgi:hypothetical protein